jgi:hypothetical protein
MTKQEYRLKRSITIDPTIGSCSNVYRSFKRLVSLAFQWNLYETPLVSGWAIPPTKLEYRLVPNFLHDFLRMFSLASQCTRYSMLMTSSWARPPTRLEYRLKRSLTFYSIVGLCLIFYRSFRRLFSLALQWKCYSATQGLVGPDHRPDKSTGSTCHNSWSDHWIVLKFLQEFSEAIFTVAMKLLLDADSLLFG